LNSSSACLRIFLGTGFVVVAKLAVFADIRVNQTSTQVGSLDNGSPLYTFEDKPQFRDECGHGFRIGVMAQDVEKVIPDAVSVHANGDKMVEYGKVMNHGI